MYYRIYYKFISIFVFYTMDFGNWVSAITTTHFTMFKMNDMVVQCT